MSGPSVCVIGAGCSGITAVKNLIQAGVEDITCYEQMDQIGGNWVYTAQTGHSSVCETTHIISSKKLSEYLDYPMPDDYPDYPSHRQLLAYFNNYADHFGIRSYIQFNTKVDKVTTTEDGRWEVKLADGTKKIFNYLLVSNGHHSVPRHPELPGEFTGEYFHSHAFKNNAPFKGKNVLVIGGGNSACDCAVECSRVGSHVAISMRRPHYIIPKFFLGKPTDTFNENMLFLPRFIANPLLKLSLKIQVGKYENYGLPTPDFEVTKDHPTLNSELLYMIRHGEVHPRKGIKQIEGKEVTFTDGQKEEYDVIIAATGYKIVTPFFDKDFLDYSDADRVPLYLRMFHPEHEGLIFIGLVQPQGCIWPLSDAQSKLAANLIMGRYYLPHDLHQKAENDSNRIEQSFLKRKRHSIEVHYHPYLRRLLHEIPADAPEWGKQKLPIHAQ